MRPSSALDVAPPSVQQPDSSRETPFHEIVRCLGDCRCPTRPCCWTVGRNEIADAVGDVAGSCPPLLFSCAGTAGAATGAGAVCRVLPTVAPGSPGGGGPRVGFRGARCRGFLPVPARPGGLGKFLRRASPSFLGRARVGCLPWRGCGAAEHHHLLFRQHTGAGAASKQHRQQTPAASPTKKSTLEAPADLLAALPVLRRESPVAVVAVPPRRPRLAGTDASTAPPLPPAPVCRPHVYRAKLNTTASGKIYPGKCQQRAFYSQMEGATTSLIDGSVFAR